VQRGLSDTWPQLRYAGCFSAKALLTLIQANDELKKIYYPTLLPPICLNRYHNAEGIGILALQIWKDTAGDKGKDYVLEYIDKFVKYYTTQTKSKNNLIRESACHCICELYTKVAVLDKDKVKKFIPQLLECLIQLIDDPSWEVRHAACSATSKLIPVTSFNDCRNFLMKYYRALMN
jgi:hypothetical protein